MARLWKRLQEPTDKPEQIVPSSAAQTSFSCLKPNEDSPMQFIEVGNGFTQEASQDIIAHLKSKKNSKPNSKHSVQPQSAKLWHWPNDLPEWPEHQVTNNILDIVARKLPNNSTFGFVASDSIIQSSLIKLMISISWRASLEGCNSALIAGDLPLPAGMPSYLGIREYLAGKASADDICSLSSDGMATLVTAGNLNGALGHYTLQENTYLGLLKAFRRRFSLVISGFYQNNMTTITSTFLSESDGIFIVAEEGEESIVEKWQKMLAHHSVTYLGWISFRSQITSPGLSLPWQSPSDRRRVG